MNLREISSANNPYLKEIAKVRKTPTEDRFFIEGTKFVEELPAECILEVFTTDTEKHKTFLESLPNTVKIYLLSSVAMGKICAAVSDQTIACTLRRLPLPRPNKLVLLDRVQDPGNVGTIIRTAYAFGFGVLLSPGCANPWSAKTLMSTAGAFRSCYIEQCGDLQQSVTALQKEGFCVYATALDPTAVTPSELKKEEKQGVIIGSEGQGISPALLSVADKTVYIPMDNPINSLNAAVAAALMIYTLH